MGREGLFSSCLRSPPPCGGTCSSATLASFVEHSSSLLIKNGFILTNIGMLADHKEQLAKLTGNLLFRNLVTCLEDACDKTFTHEAQVVEEGEPEVRDEELDEDDFQEELSAPEPSKEM